MVLSCRRSYYRGQEKPLSSPCFLSSLIVYFPLSLFPLPSHCFPPLSLFTLLLSSPCFPSISIALLVSSLLDSLLSSCFPPVLVSSPFSLFPLPDSTRFLSSLYVTGGSCTVISHNLSEDPSITTVCKTSSIENRLTTVLIHFLDSSHASPSVISTVMFDIK